MQAIIELGTLQLRVECVKHFYNLTCCCLLASSNIRNVCLLGPLEGLRLRFMWTS